MMTDQEGNQFEESVTSVRRIADHPDAIVVPELQGSVLVQDTPAPRRMEFSIEVPLGVMLGTFLFFLPACSSSAGNPMVNTFNLLEIGLPVLWMLLTFTIVFKLLNGTINTSGLLLDKDTGAFSPARLQFLIFTLAIAATYVGSGEMIEKGNKEMMTLMEEFMGGSTSIYLAAKGWPMFKKNLT